MKTEFLYDFISKNKYAVLSTVTKDNLAEAALVGIWRNMRQCKTVQAHSTLQHHLVILSTTRLFIEELHSIDYKGYLTSEYCLPVYKNHQFAGIEEVDHC